MPLCNLLRCPICHDSAASVSAFGAHVDDIVCRFDNIEVVLDDNCGIAPFDKFAEDLCQLGNIVKMEAGCRFVKNIDRLSGALAGKFCGKLDPLGFSAGKLRGGLAELDIPQADIVESLDLALDRGDILKKGQRLFDRHFKDIRDIFTLVTDLQGLTVVAFSVAYFAGNIDVRQEVHFDLDNAVSGAGLAPSALHVEGKTAFGITAGAGVLRTRKKRADQVKDAGVGRRVGTGCAPDGGLIDVDHLVQLIDPLDVVVLSGYGPGTDGSSP